MFTVNNLSAGNHSIVIEATGKKNASSQLAWVSVDAFEAEAAVFTPPPDTSNAPVPQGYIRVDHTNPAIQYVGTWNTWTSAGHEGGALAAAVDDVSRATFTFNGTAVRWIGFREEYLGVCLGLC